MRSRYTAFVKSNAAYLSYSWHQDTAPDSIGDLPDGPWAPLEILATNEGSQTDLTGQVEFRTSYDHGDHDHTIHEISTFGRVDGRWVYIDGIPKRPRR